MENLIKKPLFWIVIALVLVVGGFLYIQGLDETVLDDDVVLRVNDIVFTNNDLKANIDQINQELQMHGVEATEQEIKEQAVENLIQQALIATYAMEKGLEASQEEIDQQIQEIMAMSGIQDEDEFLGYLEMQGIESVEAFRKLLSLEIKINKLISFHTEEIEISQEVLTESYDDYVSQMEALGEEPLSFEEVRDDIREELAQGEVIEIILKKIEELRNEVEIEIFLD